MLRVRHAIWRSLNHAPGFGAKSLSRDCPDGDRSTQSGHASAEAARHQERGCGMSTRALRGSLIASVALLPTQGVAQGSVTLDEISVVATTPVPARRVARPA